VAAAGIGYGDRVLATSAPRLDGPRPDPAEGVFETTLVVEGRAVELDAHLARLAASLDALYGQALPEGAAELVGDGAAPLALGRLRLTVAPGAEPNVRTAEVERAIVFPAWEGAAEVACVIVPGGIGAHKWADRRLLQSAEEELAPAVPLVVDSDGAVLEGSRSNLFVARRGRVTTPPLDGRLLPGVARARAIAVARAVGIEVVEQPVGIDELAGADEVFMTGGVRGVEPVRRCLGLAEWDSDEIAARVGAQMSRIWLGSTFSS
jgi:para-aminobenzoate synthetase/4-amino-4-deoxychorismate lyase